MIGRRTANQSRRRPAQGAVRQDEETRRQELDDLVRILKKPKNALVKQYQKLFELEGVSLEFTHEALRSIADKSLQKKLGARGLKSIIEELMLDRMYQLPSAKTEKTIKISKRMVERNA